MKEIPEIPIVGYDSKETKGEFDGKETLKEFRGFKEEDREIMRELEKMLPLYNEKLKKLNDDSRSFYKIMIGKTEKAESVAYQREFDALLKEWGEINTLLERLEKHIYAEPSQESLN